MTDFSAVERELRDIDDDFNCGRMNAFGTTATHEEILREMKKISELEIQVFFRSCEQIAGSLDEESAIQRTLAEHIAVSRAEKRAVQQAASPGNASATPTVRFADPASPGVTSPTDQTTEASGAASSGRKVVEPESIVKLCDTSFAEIGKMFRAREASLRAIGDNLRQMSKHVVAVNEMVQRAHGASFST